jgi:hypothetical protein
MQTLSKKITTAKQLTRSESKLVKGGFNYYPNGDCGIQEPCGTCWYICENTDGAFRRLRGYDAAVSWLAAQSVGAWCCY